MQRTPLPSTRPSTQRRPPVRAQLVEEPDPAVLGAERDVVLAEQPHRHRPVPVHEVRRQRERQPVVLAHEPAHRRVALDAGQQLVLLTRDHEGKDTLATLLLQDYDCKQSG